MPFGVLSVLAFAQVLCDFAAERAILELPADVRQSRLPVCGRAAVRLVAGKDCEREGKTVCDSKFGVTGSRNI